jgi:hypothetical protein
LPLAARTAVRFVQGAGLGFALAAILVGGIAFFGGYSVEGLALHGSEFWSDALLYELGFTLVGMFEEFAFRGFLQATLQRGIGFRSAAVLLSLAFGAVHLPNLHANACAIVSVVAFGLAASLALRRTGNIGLFIGVHAAFDGCLAFIYAAPIAGQPVEGSLLRATFVGPAWLTGGSVGPLGSALCPVVKAGAGLAVHLLFPLVQQKDIGA